MRILEIEKIFESEETLSKVLDLVTEEFERIDYHSGLMRQGITTNSEEALNALSELTGIYMSLKAVLAIAETEKKNREIRKYNEIKKEIENTGTKFVSASAEKEASSSVANYRRLRNIIQAYTDSCEKAISILQSITKYLGEEIKLQGYNKGEK